MSSIGLASGSPKPVSVMLKSVGFVVIIASFALKLILALVLGVLSAPAYTVNVDYDENLLEYVSSQGGTANNTGSKVIVVYYYNAGGTDAPRTNMSITFKAKEGENCG